MFSKYLTLMPVISVLSLSGCATHPQFTVEKKADAFRETNLCRMKDNIVETQYGNFTFDLVAGEGGGLIKEYFVVMNSVPSPYSYHYKWLDIGEYVILTPDNFRPIKLRLHSYSVYGKKLAISNGLYSNNATLTEEEVKAIVAANSIKFNLEVKKAEASVTGEFSPLNIKNLKEFSNVCMQR